MFNFRSSNIFKINKYIYILLIITFSSVNLYSKSADGYIRPSIKVLTSGKWKGVNSIYLNKNFDVLLKSDGIFSIYLKGADGKYLNKSPIRYGLFEFFYFKNNNIKNGRIYRRPIKFTKYPKPSSTPRNIVEIAGISEDNITFKFKIEFKKGSIFNTFSYKEPRGIRISNKMVRTLIYIPKSYTIPNDTPQDERIKILKGSKLVTIENETNKKTGRTKKRKFTYKYYNPLKFKGSMKKGLIEALPWLPRKISFFPKRSSKIYGWIYPNFCPWEGFFIYAQAKKLGKTFTSQLKID